MNQLLDRARSGDAEAEQELMQELLKRFRVLARRKVNNSEDADDIAQEACVIVLEKYRTETFTASFEAWAYGVLRNRIGNHIQSTKVRAKRSASSTIADIISRSLIKIYPWETGQRLEFGGRAQIVL